MEMKLIGAVLVVVGCGGFGFSIAAGYKREERTLRQLLAALQFMECELQYHLTPLPKLCMLTASRCGKCLKTVFTNLATELESQIAPDVQMCMKAVISKSSDIPKRTQTVLLELGRYMGNFDLSGQIKELSYMMNSCKKSIEDLEANREVRLRSYQTLGLCAGAALAILLI